MTIATPIKITRTEVSSTEVWVYANSEMADMDNPGGDVYETVPCVIATTASGRRFIHPHQGDEETIKALAEAVSARGLISPSIWVETYEVYGSDAWQAEDDAREFAHQAGPLRGTVRDW